MIRGLYSSTAGMLSEFYRTENIANDLANVDTTGYKRTETSFQTFPVEDYYRIKDPEESIGLMPILKPRRIGLMGTGVMVDDTQTIFEQGRLEKTDNPLDVALVGDGFFVVTDPKGRVRYTRNGRFGVDREGFIVDNSGNNVVGFRYEATLPQDEKLVTGKGELHQRAVKLRVDPMRDVTITSDGLVLQGQDMVGKIVRAKVSDPLGLRRMGGNLYSMARGHALDDETTQIRQGYLEGSNVNAVKAMTDLITAQRSYEASQRLITSQDESLGRLITIIRG